MDANKEPYIYTLLTLGKMGIGKSTFWNLLAGHQIFKTSGFGVSCTKEVSSQQIPFNDFILLGIDPPGFNDIEGEQNNSNKITDYLKNLESGLNAVAIVISASDYRLDTNFQNSIKRIYNFFGNGNFWYHVCFVVTHSPAYPEDIAELKESMTTGEFSLKSIMLQTIKDVCNLNQDPEIPFFFFDSKHPNNSPSKESLPEFISWLKQRAPFDTRNLENIDVEWQYKEERQETKTTDGPQLPIYELLPGEPVMMNVEEDVPYTVKENRVHVVEREFEEWVDRDWDAGDICSLGLARLFRDNKVKITVKRKVYINVVEDVVKYLKVTKSVFSGEYGEMQKHLRGYYQEITSITDSYTACWPYNCSHEDIKNKTNPFKKDFKHGEPETQTFYFDENMNKLDPEHQSDKIEQLKAFRGVNK